MRTIWIRMLIVLGLLAGCAPAPSRVPELQASAPYTHPSGVFSLDVPPSWLVGDLSSGPALHVTFAPPDAARPVLTVYALRLEGDLDDTTFSATMGAYLRAVQNQNLDIVDTHAMGDGSWRVAAVRNVPGAALPVNLFMQRDGAFFSVLEVAVPASDSFLMALLAVMVNSYAVNRAAEWPAGTLEALTRTDDNLLLAGGNLSFGALLPWEDPDSVFHITGLVANHAPYSLEGVRVTAQLLDGTGAVLAEGAADVPLAVLLDGELAPFDVQFEGGWPRLAVRYELRAEAQQAGAALGAFLGPAGFEWEDRAEYDETGRLYVRGTVWNVGTAPAADSRVIVTVFDGEDRVVGVVTAPVEGGALAPGASARFEVPLPALGGDPIRYQLTVQGQRQG